MNLNLKVARMKKKLTQVELAEKVGITSKYLSQIETGIAKNPSTDLMKKLAEALETPVQELFFNEN